MKKLLVFFLLLLNFHSNAQDYPKGYFHSPLEIPLNLAGNFGEIRPNHFHAGLDLRTGQEGFAVHASADGYVSRVKVSTSGYGKVVYITHPNGFVTVYGHLSRFNGELAKYVKQAQYKSETYEVELFPKENEFTLKQGEIFAFSGNTGNSGGPHVHFEIRDAKTEFPINPLLFGLPVADSIRPLIKQVVLFPMDANARINGKNKSLKIPLASSGLQDGNRDYLPVNKMNLSAGGQIGFGIETSDRPNKGSGIEQVYSVELYKDGALIYSFQMEKFSFDETRYVNAHIDYAEKKRSSETIQRCFLLKNNRCSIYKGVVDAGIVHLGGDSAQHYFKFVVKDVNGNTSQAFLKILARQSVALYATDSSKQSCLRTFNHEGTGCRIEIPANAAYDDYSFSYSEDKTTPNGYLAPKQHILDESVPLNDNITISIHTKEIPASDISKVILVKFEKNGKTTSFGGIWKDGWITAKTKEFGTYSVCYDKTPPSLSISYPVPDKSGNRVPAKLAKGKNIRLSVSDNLSGVKSYRASIDGKWVLMEYEPKSNQLSIDLNDAGITGGEHLLEAEALDAVGNKSAVELKFVK